MNTKQKISCVQWMIKAIKRNNKKGCFGKGICSYFSDWIWLPKTPKYIKDDYQCEGSLNLNISRMIPEIVKFKPPRRASPYWFKESESGDIQRLELLNKLLEELHNVPELTTS